MSARRFRVVPDEVKEKAKKPLSSAKKEILVDKTTTEVGKNAARDLAEQFVNEVCGWACVQFIRLLPVPQSNWVTQPSMACKLGNYLNEEGWDIKMLPEERSAIILHKGKVKAKFQATIINPLEGEKEGVEPSSN